jgi:hypothetical protein
MADKLKMSIDRAAIFATVHCMSSIDIRLSERTITAFLKPFFQENSKLIRTQLREMQRIGLLERERYEGMHIFSIESAISEAIDNGDLDTIRNVGPIGLDAVLEYFRKKLLDHDHLGKSEVNQFIDDIVENNAQLNLIKYCNKKHFTDTVLDAYVCIAVCVKSVFDNDAFNFSYLDNYINMGKNYIQYMRKEILADTWAPIAEGLIENAGGAMVDFNPELKLTPKGFDYFLKELDPDMLKFLRARIGKVNVPMIQAKDIQKVDLFFNPEFSKRIDRVSSILMPQKFAEFQAGFPTHAKMKGLTMLFHGGPGSGKSEMVLQICRKTKRPLMKIDVTDFQSKWVGESERKLKQIFTDYKTACERLEVAPILFLNECDQVIGKRVGIRNSVDQMSNALQNILLEQMEQFDGIMIGTTWAQVTPSAGATPALTSTPTTLSGFNYTAGSGPSASQSFSLSGSNLTGAPANITVTGSTNYEVSNNNSTWGASTTVAYSSATLSATNVFVRLKAGLSAGTYNSETVSISGSRYCSVLAVQSIITLSTLDFIDRMSSLIYLIISRFVPFITLSARLA